MVDGIRYVSCRRDEVSISFDSSLLLRGERINGMYSLRLPMGLHGEAVKDMDSLVLGDLTVGVVKSIPAVQVVICVWEGDRLAVREVLDGQYYDTRQVSIRRDGNGGWQVRLWRFRRQGRKRRLAGIRRLLVPDHHEGPEGEV